MKMKVQHMYTAKNALPAVTEVEARRDLVQLAYDFRQRTT